VILKLEYLFCGEKDDLGPIRKDGPFFESFILVVQILSKRVVGHNRNIEAISITGLALPVWTKSADEARDPVGPFGFQVWYTCHLTLLT